MSRGEADPKRVDIGYFARIASAHLMAIGVNCQPSQVADLILQLGLRGFHPQWIMVVEIVRNGQHGK